MIRVLHVVHSMDCGGIETMLMNIYRRIDREKIQFDFLVNGEKNNYYTEEIERLGGKVLNVTPKRKNFFKNIKETIKYMKEGQYKILHIHQDSMISPAIWCAKKANIKIIFTHAHTTNIYGWYRKIATYIGRKYIPKNATLKFACSKAAAKWIYGKDVDDYILFNNAIDASKFRYSEEIYNNNRNELGINKNTFIIGTCGRLSIEKNQKFLLEVFAQIKNKINNSKLLLIGDGNEKENLLRFASELGVVNDIIITGLVENVDYYYSVLDCFVLPSFYEGLPLTGIEAQAAGIPCYFSTGITEEIKITKNVHFLPLSDEANRWCNIIIKNHKKREDTYNLIKKSGYDIGDNVKLLEENYIKYYKERC